MYPAMEIKRNKLYLGGVSAEDITQKHGTPVYVYEKDTIISQYKGLMKSIVFPKKRIYYSCKANTNLHIMKVLHKLGSYIDAVSPGEIHIALKAGFTHDRILFTGVNATREDFTYCIEQGVLVNIGSLAQLDMYGQMNTGDKVSLRINPDIGKGHHRKTITGGPDSKFGIYFDQVKEIKKIAEEHNLKIVGLHQHIGSGIRESADYVYAMDVLLKVAKQFKDLDFVDFGGGIGVPYKEDQEKLDVKSFGFEISKKFGEFCQEYGKELILCVEPGRYIVCESGFLLMQVNNKKETPKHVFVGVNSGFNHLIRPAMYGSYHNIINASNAGSEEKENLIVAGNVCESGDVFTQDEKGIVDREIEKTEIGDILVITHAGAYGFSMASEYNSRPLPAEILVSDGTMTVIREKQSFDDLMRRIP